MNPKISVIVPIYKAEAYLYRCVDSLLAQTFHDFEILLVDDGSPDKSGEICDEYALKDSRVRVFHKENGGVSSARQCGIDNALGEYTIHTDPDDWVEPTMLEELYAKAKEEDADMVICDYYVENRSKQDYIKQKPTSLDSNTVLKELFLQLHGSCWNKLIRRLCYSKYNVTFPLELSFCEDLYVNASLLKNKISVAYVNKAFYHYVQDVNHNSLSTNYTRSSFEYDLMKTRLFNSLLLHNSCLELCNKFMVANMIYRAYYGNVFSSFQFRNLMFGYRNNILTNNNIALTFRLKLYLSCLGFYTLVYQISNIIVYIKNKVGFLINR